MIQKENTLKIISPAKVNLFLAVGEKQGDFHPVLNVMHTLLLHDILYMNYEKSKNLNVHIEFLENEDSNGQIPDIKLEDNLIYKAIVLLANTVCKNSYSINVYVEKNIPLKAGLAGGSSNAAAALIGAAKIFGLDLEDERILSVAKKLGSDVPFFLKGGCALLTGKGEVYDHRLQPVNREIILAKPMADSGLSTAKVYSQFDKMQLAADLDAPFWVDEEHSHHGEDCDCGHENKLSLTQATKALSCADGVPLFNNLSNAAYSLSSDLIKIKDFLVENCGEDNVLLCGSGSCTFAYAPEKTSVEDIIHHAKHHDIWAISTQLANVKPRIVPNITQY